MKKILTRIREFYLWLRVKLAEWLLVKRAQQLKLEVEAMPKKGLKNKCYRFMKKLEIKKTYAKAAICKYALTSGNYKKL